MVADMGSKPLEISAVLRDTVQLYRSLFVRAFLTGFVVFAVLGVLELVLGLTHDKNVAAVAGAVTLAVASIGTTFVQGALVEAVDAEHRGAQAPSIGRLYSSSWSRLGALIGVSLLTGVGVALGLLVLILPGVVLAVRWTLAAPVVMLEGLGPRAAMRRSRELVRGHGKDVFVVLLNVWIRAGLAWFVFSVALTMLAAGTIALWLGGALAAALVTPYAAHALSVVYYRLTEPDKPVIAQKQPSWESIWREHDAAES
ncbi:MAG: hypothetical protein ACJ74X_04310 [Gaiellaceae bacterium]